MTRLPGMLLALAAVGAAIAPETALAQIERRPLPPRHAPVPKGAPPAPAAVARRPLPPRNPPALHRDWPIRRPPNPVIVRRRRDRDRISVRFFLPPVIFGGLVIGSYDDSRPRYDRNRLSWSDSERLYREEGWVEFVLDCDAWGEMLWLEVRDGRARVDWAEIVFSNGESQVVDFNDRALGPGLYRLFGYRGERRVDHVRVVAMATTPEAWLILRMER